MYRRILILKAQERHPVTRMDGHRKANTAAIKHIRLSSFPFVFFTFVFAFSLFHVGHGIVSFPSVQQTMNYTRFSLTCLVFVVSLISLMPSYQRVMSCSVGYLFVVFLLPLSIHSLYKYIIVFVTFLLVCRNFFK